MFLCYYVKLIFKNFNRPPNSDELNIDCLPLGDSMRKPHNLKVLQSDTSKLKNKIKMLTVSLTYFIFSICLVQFALPVEYVIIFFLFLKVFYFIIFKGSSQ